MLIGVGMQKNSPAGQDTVRREKTWMSALSSVITKGFTGKWDVHWSTFETHINKVLLHLKHVSSTALWCNDEVDVSLVSQEGRVGDINLQPCIYQVDSLFRSEAIWKIGICPETEDKKKWLQIKIFIELLVNGIYSLIFFVVVTESIYHYWLWLVCFFI